ncbi:AlwI family type II restriction endonuclease [Geobacillus stearothermophilus]|uniref:AlwI family type II restriction endonuclease n=1 Tax=Geobacillus stearothermophilus TaxID=1422 RepID=UPI002E238729|nr:AlwI family type II restriction endonuclease [Geobacillus stearothermophilus]
MTKKAWYIGNTTVRNAKRLKDGLRVLLNSPLHGNLKGRENEQEFAKLLHDEGVVFVKRLNDSPDNDASDVGRKWRAALMQLGFIKPSFAEAPFTITPNGVRLVESKTMPSEQECFLRALLAYQIPSVIEDSFSVPVFSPLRIVLEVLYTLEHRGLEAAIDKNEMASMVQLTTSLEEVSDVVNRIAQYRDRLNAITDSRARKRFIQGHLQSVATASQSANTLVDYADSNFRYLKLTGLFVEKGNKLRFADHKRTIIEQILSESYSPIPENEYLETLWNGAKLPTDNASKAIEVIQTTAQLLKESGQTVQLPNLEKMDIPDLSRLRLELEDDWLKVLEKKYAQEQVNQWQDILQYLQALTQPNRQNSIIPQGEGAAYFEWAIWRAFLAINSLCNEPWEARRFKIDQDFLPLHPAPGNGPDMIFEFEDFVIVVEVTLTQSSRQEAAEGEPVRRHVAEVVDHYEQKGKRVYGLFLANKIDTNTAETFRIGVWYRPDDSRMALRIVPLTLEQFIRLFEVGFKSKGRLDHQLVEQVIRDCLVESNNDAPEWKRRIQYEVDRVVQRLSKIV